MSDVFTVAAPMWPLKVMHRNAEQCWWSLKQGPLINYIIGSVIMEPKRDIRSLSFAKWLLKQQHTLNHAMYSSTWFDMHAILYPFQHVHEHTESKVEGKYLSVIS